MNLSGMNWKAAVDKLYRSTNEAIERRDRHTVGSPQYIQYQLEASITLNIAQALEVGRQS